MILMISMISILYVYLHKLWVMQLLCATIIVWIAVDKNAISHTEYHLFTYTYIIIYMYVMIYDA